MYTKVLMVLCTISRLDIMFTLALRFNKSAGNNFERTLPMPTSFDTATVITTRSFDMTWLTVGGDKPHTRLNDVPAAVTDANLNTMRDALAALSNAGVAADNRTTKREIANADIEAYDEAYASARDRLILKFQNAALDIIEVSVPAPDAAYFGPDGVTAIAPGAADEALIFAAGVNSVLTVINTGGGTYSYMAGYRSPLPAGFRVRALPDIVEPEAGDVPSDAPAVGGA